MMIFLSYLNAAEPTQVDGTGDAVSLPVGVRWSPHPDSRLPRSRAAAQRRLGRESPPAQSLRRSDSETDVT